MLAKNTAIVAGLTLLSRLFGFLRDLLTAYILGASVLAEAYVVALRIPNLFRSLMAEGALTSAFVPTFSEEALRSRESASNSFRQVLGFVLLASSTISVLGIVFAPELVTLFAPGFATQSAEYSSAVLLTRLMFPFLICMSVVTISNGALNAFRVFGIAAWAQVVINIVLIFGGLLAIGKSPQDASVYFAISLVLGGVVGIVVQIPRLRKEGLSLIPSSPRGSPAVRQVIKLILPATIGASIYQISIFLSTSLASLLPDGSVAWLYYADRITQLPIGIFTVALASVLLPSLSSAVAKNDTDGFRNDFERSLCTTSFATIGITSGLILFSHPLMELLFVHGKFSASDAQQAALAAIMLSLGLWGTSCYSIAVRALIAHKDTISSTRIGAVSLLITLIASLSLMGPVAPGSMKLLPQVVASLQNHLFVVSDLHHAGLALASSFGQTCSFFLAALILERRGISIPRRVFFRTTLLSTLAAVLSISLTTWLTCQTGNRYLDLFLGGTIWLGIFLGASLLFRIPEARVALYAVRSRFR